MARKGRRRKIGEPRHPGGKIVAPTAAERESEVVATAMRWRVQRVGKKHARSEQAGYSLGRLLLHGHISQLQHDAGRRWAEVSSAFGWAVMAPGKTPQSSGWFMVSSDFAPRPSGIETEPERDQRLSASDAYCEALEALRRADRERGASDYPATSIVQDVCDLDRDDLTLSRYELGELRIGLNALVKHFEIQPKRVRMGSWNGA